MIKQVTNSGGGEEILGISSSIDWDSCDDNSSPITRTEPADAYQEDECWILPFIWAVTICAYVAAVVLGHHWRLVVAPFVLIGLARSLGFQSPWEYRCRASNETKMVSENGHSNETFQCPSEKDPVKKDWATH